MRILPKPLKLLALTVGAGVTAASLLATSDVPAGDAFVFGTPKAVLACSSPVWPGTLGTTTDVQLTTLSSSATMWGCIGGCNGNSSSARVYFAPSASLKNIGSADVPWNDWINSGNSAPVAPYNNRQHPLLTWNLYRIDSDGRIDQIGRAGVKHAWYSTNVSCGCSGGHVLWAAPNTTGLVGCSDTYGASNNDETRRLGPRSEIIPKDAIWGRCGSLWDPSCNGVAIDHGLDAPAHRMMVRESDLAPALNPGAQYYFEAWYLIRDEDNPNDNFRHVRGSSSWNGSNWSSFNYDPTQLVGPAIDTFAALPPPGGGASLPSTLATDEGNVRLVTRVTPLGGGLYRYDYALMNLDFARAATQGSEPNLRVLRNHGFDRVTIPVPNAGALASIEAVDGAGLIPAWITSAAGGSLEFTASNINGTLDWGTLMRFSFVAPFAPASGSIELGVQEAGTPASYSMTTLVPGAMFMDGFEG